VDGQSAPKTLANINNLMRFLDAFKAAPLMWPDCGADIPNRILDQCGPADRFEC